MESKYFCSLVAVLTRLVPSALNYGFEMLASVVAFSSEKLSKRMLQETRIILGEGCLVRITVMRPEQRNWYFSRVLTVTQRSFVSIVVLKVFFHCYSNSLLVTVLSTFYVTIQKRCDSDDDIKLFYLWNCKIHIDITNEPSMTNYYWCCRPERRHRNVATIWKLLLKVSCVQFNNCVDIFMLFVSVL